MTTADVWTEHRLTQDEYERIRARLGREPNRVELGIAGAMWSEHCSYKSSRLHLRKLPTEGPTVVLGPGENAGVVRLEGDWCLAFKMESHNHPSYIEPYHGAATGVGGILRDVFTMGARPIANLNSLRFGRPEHPRTPLLVDGVVRGIADYGNCVGVPTVAGECSFAPCYDGNILVNAMTVGLVREDRIFLGTAAGIGNPVFYVGSKTGADGIHGATMSSASFDENAADQRPAVQVGDPFTEKLLIEACIELMDSGAVVGIQDMGAAGLTSSSFEMASRAGSGMDLHLDRVPMRQAGLGPYELMLSESQERMLVVLERGKEAVAEAIFDKWDLDIAEVGIVTDSGHVRCLWHGEVAAKLPVDLMVDDAPRYDRPHAPGPARLAERNLPAQAPVDRGAFAAELLRLVAHPTLASKRWIAEQYDSTVQGATVLGSGGEAAVIWVPEAQRAVALTVEGNSRLCRLHPRHGAMHIVAEGVRNLACVGARPLGATDCLNFGNPQRPENMWELVECIEGLAEGLRAVETPIVGGNVSLYNETLDKGIWPTPTTGFVGRVEAPLEHLPLGGFRSAGRRVIAIGALPATLAGSAWLECLHGILQGDLPAPDFAAVTALADVLVGALVREPVETLHDTAEGGLATALAEACFWRGIGFVGHDLEWTFEGLFGESTSVIVAAAPDDVLDRLVADAAARGLPVLELGHTGGDRFVLPGWCDLALSDLHRGWRDALPKLMREA